MYHLARFATNTANGWPAASSRDAARRRRTRLTPGAESLEVRDCPSGLAAHLGASEAAHALVVAQRSAGVSAQVATAERAHPLAREVHATAAARRKARTGPVIYASPTGRNNGPGKRAARPLNLTAAMAKVKNGGTIVLSPGTYTQGVVLSSKSGVTIAGPADLSAILAPSTNVAALNVNQSSNITIKNVWFRSTGNAQSATGLAVVGSSVTVDNIQTAGTYGDGVMVTAKNGVAATLDATNSHFDGSQMASGLELRAGSTATITNSTFDGNGTAPGVTQYSNGMFMNGNSIAKISDSHFDNNTNAGVVATDTANFTASGSTFSGNHTGDGALFFSQAAVTLTGNTFASNGQVASVAEGLNGIEFFGGAGPNLYTGTAVVTGNSFVNNTAAGLYVGGASNITITGNQFSNSLDAISAVAIYLNASEGTVNATVLGNTIQAVNPTPHWAGILMQGSGLTATVGGAGGDANTIRGFQRFTYLREVQGSAPNTGLPKVTLSGNNYVDANGANVPQADALYVQ